MLEENVMPDQFFRERKVMEKFSRIKHKIGVHSGKGGVGKTTVSIGIATILAKHHTTGLLDADIDCPNTGKLLGIKDVFKMEGNRFRAIEKFGMKIVSSAFLSDNEERALVMRGPMKHHALMQLIELSNIDEVEYLVIDLPPGSSDIPLTTMQMLRPDGMIFVTTPQSVAVMDMKKTINMARDLGIRILGVVENMSGPLFGEGGGEAAAKDMNVPFLGRIMLDKKIVGLAEKGIPAVMDPSVEKEFSSIVSKVLQSA